MPTEQIQIRKITMIETIDLRRIKTIESDTGIVVLSIAGVDGKMQSFFLTEEVLRWVAQAVEQLAPAQVPAGDEDLPSSLARSIKFLQ
jgi:hypothetical protein